MSSDRKYAVNEIFYSVQGEGFHAGTPMVFVRFSGCNLNCEWCDTEHQSFKWMSESEIVDAIERFPTRWVCLTGGEPMQQVGTNLVQMIKSKWKVAIETNGTFLIPDRWNLDWITVSPKEKTRVKQTKGDELKVVYCEQDLSQYSTFFFHHRFLQPLSMSNTEEVLEFVKVNPEWRISTQLQKIWKIR